MSANGWFLGISVLAGVILLIQGLGVDLGAEAGMGLGLLSAVVGIVLGAALDRWEHR